MLWYCALVLTRYPPPLPLSLVLRLQTLANTDKTSLQQYVLLKDAAPKPTSILCADWLKTKYVTPGRVFHRYICSLQCLRL